MDGDDNKIFHSKCDGYDNTLIIGESTNGRIFGGFTTQKWSNQCSAYDDYSFLFQLNDQKNYYAIPGKGAIYSISSCGPAFIAYPSTIEFSFQDGGKASQKNHNRDCTGISDIGFNYKNKNILEGNDYYALKDYEVYKVFFN